MLNREDLLAISNLLDVKLKPVKDDIVEIKKDISSLNHRVGRLEQNVGSLNHRVGRLEQDVSSLKQDVGSLKQDVSSLKQDVSSLNHRVGRLESDMHHVRLVLENRIEPRLQNIEDCYISTYKRYYDGAGQIDAMQADVNVLKGVAEEHGKQLRQIAGTM